MKYLRLIFTISLFFSSVNAFTQNENLKQDFLTRIENKLKVIDSSTFISSSQLYASNRKIKIEGKVESSRIFFKIKVKYFRGGLKKEVIKLYQATPDNTILFNTKIIKINDEIFYVKNFEREKYNETSIKELYFDNKSYQKTVYNESNKIISSKTHILLSSDK